MAQFLNYVPIVLDVVVVVFLVMCMRQGYKEGLSRCMRAAGEFFALILAVWFALDLPPHFYTLTKFMVGIGEKMGVSASMVTTVMKYAVPIILFVILFSVFLVVWRYVTEKTDKLATKQKLRGLDKVGGVLMELLMGITIVALIGWFIYDLLGLISTSIMQSTIVVSTILNIL